MSMGFFRFPVGGLAGLLVRREGSTKGFRVEGLAEEAVGSLDGGSYVLRVFPLGPAAREEGFERWERVKLPR